MADVRACGAPGGDRENRGFRVTTSRAAPTAATISSRKPMLRPQPGSPRYDPEDPTPVWPPSPRARGRRCSTRRIGLAVVAVLLVLALLAAPAILRAPVRRHAAAATLLPPPLPAFSSARHLIIVAGHAIYTDASGRDRGRLAHLGPFVLLLLCSKGVG